MQAPPFECPMTATSEPQLEGWTAGGKVFVNDEGQMPIAAAESACANRGVETINDSRAPRHTAQEEACVSGVGQEPVAVAKGACANGGVETAIYDSAASRNMTPLRDWCSRTIPTAATESRHEELPEEERLDATVMPVTTQPPKSPTLVRLAYGERPACRFTPIEQP